MDQSSDDNSDRQADHYAELPYLNYCFPNTHVDKLATVAKLFGLDPPAPTTARVLELGAALGGNLIPMAYGLPNATFVGMDLSAPQIAQANAGVKELGLTNIEFRAADILEIDDSWGTFDYIICHGVYSWVPPHVQAKILEVCGRQLTPTGVAMISYNVLPGWHPQVAVRDLMRYHAGNFDTVSMRLSQGMGILGWAAANAAKDESAYRMVLERLYKSLQDEPAAYIYHEYMEAFNEPLYFHQFNARLGPAGLQYLGDAQIGTMVPQEFPPETQQSLSQVARDLLAIEQYLDFLRNRRFRNSLVVRHGLPMKRSFDGSTVAGLRVGSHFRDDPALVEKPDERGFRANDKRFMTTDDPFVIAVLDRLAAAWPESLEEGELLARLTADPGRIDPAHLSQGVFRQRLVQLFMKEVVHMEVGQPPVTRIVPERPRASRVARWRAALGENAPNLRHKTAALNEDQLKLLNALDGTRTIADVAALFEVTPEHAAEGVSILAQMSLIHAD